MQTSADAVRFCLASLIILLYQAMSNFVFTYGRLLAFSKFGPDQSLEFVQPRAKLSDSHLSGEPPRARVFRKKALAILKRPSVHAAATLREMSSRSLKCCGFRPGDLKLATHASVAGACRKSRIWSSGHDRLRTRCNEECERFGLGDNKRGNFPNCEP